MNTFLSSEQEAQAQEYRQLAEQIVAPLAEQMEANPVTAGEVLHELAGKGLLGLSVPKEMGGQSLPFLNVSLFTEAVAQHEAGLALSLASHFAVIEVLKKHGTQTQKSRFLPLLARGELLATLAFTEPQAGTDFKAVATVAKKDKNQFAVSGKKTWVVNAETATLWLTLTKKESGRLALFLVDGTDKRVLISPNHPRLGLRSAQAHDVEIKDLLLQSEAEIEGDADTIAQFALDAAKVVLAAGAVGLLQSCLKLAVEHARSREQFGVNIGQFQGIQWKLADMVTETTGAQLQVMKAAWSLDEEPEAFSKNAAMCKWFASRAARVHSSEAVQVLGMSGLSESSPAERFYRDAKAMEICLGTSEGQKVQLVQELHI